MSPCKTQFTKVFRGHTVLSESDGWRRLCEAPISSESVVEENLRIFICHVEGRGSGLGVQILFTPELRDEAFLPLKYLKLNGVWFEESDGKCILR